jgi:hypothetical protein
MRAIRRWIIGIWMSARMLWADAFHHAPVLTPDLFPVSHVVLAWIVDTAIVSLADFLGMDVR